LVSISFPPSLPLLLGGMLNQRDRISFQQNSA
jgi:hypothetical protein